MMNIFGRYYYYYYHVAIVVQLPSRARLFVTLWIAACQASLSFTIPQFAQVHVYCIGDTIQPSHPLVPSSPLPSIFPSIRDFLMSCLFTSDEQNTRASASASVLSVNI